jgi:hypothetical protein
MRENGRFSESESWERGDVIPLGECTFLYGKGNENHELGRGFSF